MTHEQFCEWLQNVLESQQIDEGLTAEETAEIFIELKHTLKSADEWPLQKKTICALTC